MNEIIPKDALVVVADGAKAILFRYKGGDGAASLREEERLDPKNLLDDGPSGSRPEEQTSQQTDEATFAKQLANRLYKMSHNGSYDSLVLIADPQTLGQLRSALHGSVEQKVVMSLNKDLTNQSVVDIAAALH